MIEVAGAMIIRERRVLLGLRSPHRRICPNLWDFIGGHLEAGESPEAAVRREVREEIGVEAAVLSPVAVIDFSEAAARPLLYQLFRVDAVLGEPALMNSEHTALGWFDLGEAAALQTLASDLYRPILRQAYAAVSGL